MRISVVLCTCNGERFLPAQLESIVAQTQRPDEIIACDDASTDNSPALLDAFAARMQGHGVNVQVHRQPDNLGVVDNFSDALRRASGDVVFLCDQDDLWHPHKIERMAAEFTRRPGLELLHTDADLIDAQGHPLGHTLFEALEFTAAEREAEHRGDAFNVLLRRNTVTGATAALRTRLIERALPVPEGLIHDEWLALCVALHGQVDCLEWASIGYRQHANNQIGIRMYSHWERLTRPKLSKRAYLQHSARRLQALVQRHQDAPFAVNARPLEGIRAHAAHVTHRVHLPESLLPRLRMVLAEAVNGHYWRYSSGWRSLASDLLGRP